MGTPCAHGNQYRELLPEHALGTLIGEESRELQSHLGECATCSAELLQIERMLDVVAHAAPVNDPPLDLRDNVLAAIAQEAGEISATAEEIAQIAAASSRARATRRRRTGGFGARLRRTIGGAALPALAVACVLLAGLAVFDARHIDRLQSRVDEMRSRQTLAVLKGADIATVQTSGGLQKATAQVAIKNGSGVVAMRNVPRPPEGMVWQVWQVDDTHRISKIGTIRRPAQVLFLPLKQQGDHEIERVIITAEPARGSAFPNRSRIAGTSTT